MTFDYWPLHFTLTAIDSVRFPAGRAGNMVRGAFGMAFRAAAPDVYQRVFEPAGDEGPSGLADRPRPFVFRVRHLNGRTIRPGERFALDINLFAADEHLVPHFAAAIAELARGGLGPEHARAELTDTQAATAPVRLPLHSNGTPVGALAVDFLTPTELKPVNRPEFAILFNRVRDRISTLASLYGRGPLTVDFAALGTRAAGVTMRRCQVRDVDLERRSARTGQVHPIGGFVGSAEYAGELCEFLPWLRAAAFTGVGRHTVWGNGEMVVRVLAG